MNFQIPRALHIAFMIALAIIGTVTALVAKGDLQISVPIMSLISMAALVIHSVDPETAAKIAASAKWIGCVVIFSFLQACLATAPTVPVTPANQQQIASCTNIGALHNGVVVGDFVLGAGTTGVASAAALVSDTSTKNALAVTGIVLGALSAAGTAVAGFTSAEFSNSQCSVVVGPLPASKRPAQAALWVPDEELGR